MRATVVNDSYVPVELSRNALIGANLTAVTASGMPLPPSVEPTGGPAEGLLPLQPFTRYGRDRFFDGLAPGSHEFTAEYLPPDGSGEPIRAATAVVIIETAAG